MKKLMMVFVSLFFLTSCDKNEIEGVNFTLSGQVVDIYSGEPVSGVWLFVDFHNPEEDPYFFNYQILDKQVTDAEGQFRLTYLLKNIEDNEFTGLKIASISYKYQNCVRVNAQEFSYMIDNPNGWNRGYYPITNGAHYQIELIQPPYFRVVKPVIPVGWEDASLYLTITNLYTIFTWSDTKHYQFNLDDEDEWLSLAQPQGLYCGNVAPFSFTLKHGDSTKTKDYHATIAYGDTTDVVLPLFE